MKLIWNLIDDGLWRAHRGRLRADILKSAGRHYVSVEAPHCAIVWYADYARLSTAQRKAEALVDALAKIEEAL